MNNKARHGQASSYYYSRKTNDPEQNPRFLAAKSHYYGVGGGTRLFEDFITKEENFTYESVKVMEASKFEFALLDERKYKSLALL